jgi:hypothetical protein
VHIKVFSEAMLVVAPHGGTLANLLFSRGGGGGGGGGGRGAGGEEDVVSGGAVAHGKHRGKENGCEEGPLAVCHVHTMTGLIICGWANGLIRVIQSQVIFSNKKSFYKVIFSKQNISFHTKFSFFLYMVT